MIRCAGLCLAVSMSLALAACGGGGGSSQEGSEQGPFALRGGNAVAAAQVVFDGLEQISGLGNLATLMASSLADQPTAMLGCPQPGSAPTVLTRTDNDGDPTLSAGDVLTLQGDCFGARRLSMRVTALADGQLEGSVEFTQSEFSFGSVTGTFTLRAASSTTPPQARWSATDIALTITSSGAQIFADAAFAIEVDASRRYNIEFSGKLTSASLGGALEFATPVPLSGDAGDFPGAGEIVLRAAGSGVRITPASDPLLAMLQIDATGSGQYGAATPTPWLMLTTGTPFGYVPNGAPVFLELAVGPDAPTASDDLRVVLWVIDPDGDELTQTFEWRRNGARLDGATSAQLPAGRHRKGDVIELIVTANDGETTATATASVTIVDAPPVIDASVPASVHSGHPLTFTARVSDADGDPTGHLRLTIDHGPSGMTLDPATGIVTWVADLPMFDRSVDVNLRIGVEGGDAVPFVGVVRVEDPLREYALMRTAIEAPLADGLEIGDFDGDGDTEMLILSERSLYELAADGAGGYREAWMYPFALSPDAYSPTLAHGQALAAADVDGDRAFEIFVAAGTRVFALDGVTRRPVASVDIEGVVGCFELEIADLDGDGAAELVCLARLGSDDMAALIVLNARNLEIVARLPDAEYGRSVAFGNVDGDPAIEIVTSGGYVLDGVTLQNEWVREEGFGPFVVDTGDLDGDGVEEIVSILGLRLRGFGAPQQDPLWELVPAQLSGALLVADYDGDGTPEIIVGGGESLATLTVYRYDAGTRTLDTVDVLVSSPWLRDARSIGIGDVDADGTVEVVRDSGTGSTAPDSILIAAPNPALVDEWVTPAFMQFAGSFSGGQLAGSAADLAPPRPMFANHADGTRLVTLDPGSGDLAVSEAFAFGGGSTLAVTDYDGDGTEEAIVASSVSSAASGYATVYDFFAAASEWQIQYGSRAVAITTGDMTGDGRADIVWIMADGSVYVHNAITQSLVWEGPALEPILDVGLDVLVLDANRDGALDIVVVAQDRVVLYERSSSGSTYGQAATYRPPNDILDAAVADTDGDGQEEIAILVRRNANLRQAASIQRLGMRLDLLGTADYDGPARWLTRMSSGAERNLLLGVADVTTGTPLHVAAVDARTGADVWRSPPLLGVPGRNSLHVVELGGRLRISIGTQSGMYLTR